MITRTAAIALPVPYVRCSDHELECFQEKHAPAKAGVDPVFLKTL